MAKRLHLALLFLLLLCQGTACAQPPATQPTATSVRHKPWVLISTDIGGSDPDDKQSMAHALLYADRLHFVGLVSTPTRHGGRASDLLEVIAAYEKDYPNLKTWSADYPTPAYLRSIVHQGQIEPQPPEGFSAQSSPGTDAIVQAAYRAREAGRPLWVLVWGAATDLAQALHTDPRIVTVLRVYSIGDWNTEQDRAARDYIHRHHPALWWIENDSSFRGLYIDENGRDNNGWRMEDARGHGALGEYFVAARPWGLKMGDTPSLLYLIDHADDGDPTADSWGGSFIRDPMRPQRWIDDPDRRLDIAGYAGAETIRRFQAAIYRDIAARFDRARAPRSPGTPLAASARPGG
jgi:hypothetical protein